MIVVGKSGVVSTGLVKFTVPIAAPPVGVVYTLDVTPACGAAVMVIVLPEHIVVPGVIVGINAVGKGLTVTLTLSVPTQPYVLVTVTSTVPVPTVVQLTVIDVVPAPVAIVPPVTTQAMVLVAGVAACMLYVPTSFLHTVVFDVVITGFGVGFNVKSAVATTTGQPGAETVLVIV
jgi:hypothetical protein